MKSPEPQEQMQEQVQEPSAVHSEIPWYAHPSTIGPIGAAIIVAIVGPLLIWKITSNRKRNNG